MLLTGRASDTDYNHANSILRAPVESVVRRRPGYFDAAFVAFIESTLSSTFGQAIDPGASNSYLCIAITLFPIAFLRIQNCDLIAT